jgi:hypothetical protein
MGYIKSSQRIGRAKTLYPGGILCTSYAIAFRVGIERPLNTTTLPPKFTGRLPSITKEATTKPGIGIWT